MNNIHACFDGELYGGAAYLVNGYERKFCKVSRILMLLWLLRMPVVEIESR